MSARPFSATHERFRAEVRELVENRLRPHASQWERAQAFPRRVLSECARRGYLNLDPWHASVLAEELPHCDSLGLALSVFVQANLIAPLLRELGSAQQKRAFLAPLLRGRMLGCLAVSEPTAGSDFGALRCEARRDGSSIVLNGRKTYITNAAIADFFIVAARTPAADPEGLSLVLVPAKTPGARVTRLGTLGLRTSATGAIDLRNCRVGSHRWLGKPGQAFGHIQRALNRERLFGGIAAVSWAAYALEKTVAFARERKAFGGPIARFQAVRHQIADMATRLEAARQLNYATLGRWARGEEVAREICMIKLYSYQVAQEVITGCLQLHGGLGYLDNHWTSRFYRDARALTIAAGTPEVMKDMIAAYLRV